MPSAIEEQSPKTEPAPTASEPEQSTGAAAAQSEVPESAREEIPAITGEPSVNIEPSEPARQESSSAESGE
jgi:hypothetical protein